MAEVARAVVIAVENLEMAYGDQKILEKATLTLHEGERVALVGRNGCGKSTFMKILVGAEQPDAGTVTRRKGLRIGYLPQEFTLDRSVNVYENILQGVRHVVDMIKEYESLLGNSLMLANSGSSEDKKTPNASVTRLHQLEESINQAGGWNLDNKIESVMTALKCPPKEREIQNLSGGEKRRVALAKTLISEPDLIILDEPTNHLDTVSIEWLENMIQIYKGTCLFVTHDRFFLDRISTLIIELSRGEFQAFRGNYSDYLKNKAKQVECEEIAEGKRQKFLKKELEWVQRGPKARTTKAQFRVNRFYDTAAQKAPEKELDIDLIIPPATRLGNRVVDILNATMCYGKTVLFRKFTFKFEPGAKIGIIGPNGVGKTTLIKTIIGQIQPAEGNVEISTNTQFNAIDQERLTLNDEKTVIEEVGDGHDFVMLGDEKISIWGYLKRFLFTDERIRTKVGRLSGGERARLLLAKILRRGGNFIVLDEPTNDLDLSTLRLLEEALIEFKGCVLLTSHDRYFLNRVCSGILAFEKNGQITYHVGNYDYYMSKRGVFLARGQERKKSKGDKSASSTPKFRRLKWKEERELELMEESIMRIEAEIENLQDLFMNPDFYKESRTNAKDVREKLNDAQSKRDELYIRWEELEAIKNGKVPLV